MKSPDGAVFINFDLRAQNLIHFILITLATKNMKSITAIIFSFASFIASAGTVHDQKIDKMVSDIYKGKANVIKSFPAYGYSDGLAGFIKSNQLVITQVDGTCSFVKNGMCQIDAYITRRIFKRHRSDDAGAFCGALLKWESPENDMKNWTPTSGLSQTIASEKIAFALSMIDDKNQSYCK
jgi:hypothetical protein